MTDLPFQFICQIIPELDKSGKPFEYMPQSRYKNSKNHPLHKFGNGPFCKFKIPSHYSTKTGVYAITQDDVVVYVGECVDLTKRYNMGYGNISPKNCFKGGQPTNCRINSQILQSYKNGKKLNLLFYETKDRFKIENELIVNLNPVWNKTVGKPSKTYQNQRQ